jgi:hypothetical protein
MEFQTAQELYDKSLCIFPDCTAVSSKIPVTLKANIRQHIRCFNDHNTPAANAYKQRLIGKLTYKQYGKRNLVSFVYRLFGVGQSEFHHQELCRGILSSSL